MNSYHCSSVTGLQQSLKQMEASCFDCLSFILSCCESAGSLGQMQLASRPPLWTWNLLERVKCSWGHFIFLVVLDSALFYFASKSLSLVFRFVFHPRALRARLPRVKFFFRLPDLWRSLAGQYRVSRFGVWEDWPWLPRTVGGLLLRR